MLFVALLAAQAAPSPAPTCAYDHAALMSLSQEAFDQDMAGGWRKLALAGCDEAAADVVRDWRTAHGANASILFWHEGQLRAMAGQTERAVALFSHTYKTKVDDGFGWNLYVDGSIAFLRRDRQALETARAKLARLPRPADFAPHDPNGKPMDISWPINLDVLDRLRTCWDQPYKRAYACNPSTQRTTTGPTTK